MKKKVFFFLSMVFLLVSIDLSLKFWAEEKLITEASEYLEKNHSEESLSSFKANYDYLVNYQNFSDDKKSYLLKELTLIPERLSLIYTRNYNIGFSILSFLNNYFTPHQISLIIKLLQGSVLIIILIYFFYNKMKYFWAFTFIISGGIGNNLDRLFRGYVVDYIKFSFPEIPWSILNPWPIFNFADISVCLGGGLLLFSFILEKPAYANKS